MSAPTRREALKAMLLGTGALAIGFALPGCHGPEARMAERAEATGEFVPNAWLQIRPDDTFVFVLDRVEMGQGTMTSHATILAEELDLDPRRLQVSLATAHRSYDNPDPQLGFQITGGSTSVKTSWTPLRRAGAAAREMLRAAAAATWSAPIAECDADDGVIVHRPTGRKLTYGALAKAAAHQSIPSEPPLKDPSRFKWIGRELRRLDGRAKVDGSAIYGLDVKLDGLLVAVVLRAPVPGATLARFDAKGASTSPGFVDAFAIPSGVAVVATTFWEARAAAAKVDVQWNEGDLAQISSDALRAQFAERAKSKGSSVRDDGSFVASMAGAKILEAVYEAPYLAHATMEPQNATAHVEAERVRVWAPTQSPGLAREEVRRITGKPYEAIEIRQTLLGGGFGRRLVQDYVAEAVHASMHVKRPVKIVFTREDDMRHDFYRPATYNVLRASIANGALTGWFHRIVAQSIVAQVGKTWLPAIAPDAMPLALKHFFGRTASRMYESSLVADESSHEGASDFAYAIPNVRVEHALVEPGLPVGFWRSVGNSENVFVVESFVDEVAHAMGFDPVALRRALLGKSSKHLAVLERVAKEAGWGSAMPTGRARGVAIAKAFGAVCAHVADVSVEKGAIRVHRVVAAIDCGTVVNPDLVKAQVESAVVFGLSAALRQKITYEKGRVRQSNFHDYPLVRMFESPAVDVHIVPSDGPPEGVGEGGLPPIAPAVANAVFALTGKRLRSMPLEEALAKV